LLQVEKLVVDQSKEVRCSSPCLIPRYKVKRTRRRVGIVSKLGFRLEDAIFCIPESNVYNNRVNLIVQANTTLLMLLIFRVLRV
jgi:hypothetical protein